jgi:hypothetical protein
VKTLGHILLHGAQLGGAVALAIFFFQWFACIVGGSLVVSLLLHKLDSRVNAPSPSNRQRL